MLALGGRLYHSWEWGETRARIGWRPWRVLVDNDGIPCAALQIFERQIPALGASLLCASSGIAGNSSDGEIIQAFAEWARKFARERHAIVLRVEGHFDDSNETQRRLLVSSGFRGLPDQWSLWNLPRANMIIDIRGNQENLLHRMRKKHREHILRAQRSSVKIEKSSDFLDLQAFYGLLLKSSERQRFAVRDFDYFWNVHRHLLQTGRGSLFIATMDGKPVAGILCGWFGSACHYLYGGFDWSARQAYANEALHWAAIQWARALGCSHYDMVGAGTQYPPVEGNPGYGVYNFKKGFGADLVYSAGYFDLVNRPALYAALRFAETHTSWVTAARGAHSFLRRVFARSRRTAAQSEDGRSIFQPAVNDTTSPPTRDAQ